MLLGPPATLSPTERTTIVTQLCLRSWIGLWETYYYAQFDIMHSTYLVFLPMWGSQILLFGLLGSLVWRWSTSSANYARTMPPSTTHKSIIFSPCDDILFRAYMWNVNTYLHFILCEFASCSKPYCQWSRYSTRTEPSLLSSTTLRRLQTHSGSPTDIQGPNACTKHGRLSCNNLNCGRGWGM